MLIEGVDNKKGKVLEVDAVVIADKYDGVLLVCLSLIISVFVLSTRRKAING